MDLDPRFLQTRSMNTVWHQRACAELKECDSMSVTTPLIPRRRAKAVFLTALPLEYKAVCAHLTDLREVTHPQGTIYELGEFKSPGQTWEIVVAEVGKGNPRAAIEA